MKATVEQINSVQTRIKIDCDQSDVSNEFDKAYRSVKKKARVHGFRPGKAPLSIIRRIYGNSVAAEVADNLIKSYLFSAISDNELRPISTPVLEASALPKEGEGYSFSAVVDLMPEVDIVGYKGLKLSYKESEPQEELIDNELKNLQRNQAKTKSVEPDTTAAEGHLVTFNQKALTSDDQPIEEMNAEGISAELGGGQLYPELEKALVDRKVGESSETTITLPEDHDSAALAGKPIKVQLHVTNIQELQLPDMDDEWAKDLGLESMADLKGKITERVVAEIERYKRHQLESGIFEQLRAKNDFEVPPAIVDQIIDGMIESASKADKKTLAKLKADESFRKRFRDDAIKQAKNTVILMDVIKKESLEVKDEDIEKHLNETYGAMFGEDERAKEFLEKMKQNFQDREKESLLFSKALEFIIAAAELEPLKK